MKKSLVYRLGLLPFAVMLLGAAGCSSGESSVCASVDCGAHGSCVVADSQATCLCDPGYVTDGLACIEDPCASSACVHGTCRSVGKNAVCDCQPGYTDTLCDSCAPGYRLDGLTCIVGSPCQGDPCVYGVCRSVGGLPQCDCYQGYTGAVCDACAPGYHPADLRCVTDSLCDPDPCAHGSCSQSGGVATCNCEAGYSGDTCEQCAPGYHEEGLSCVPDVAGPCDPNPCNEQHRTVCTVAGDGYKCACDSGYHDHDGACVLDTACDPDPCTQEHQAGCQAGGLYGYTCLCEAGYQDNDSNNTCLPDCQTAAAQSLIDCAAVDCDDSSGTAWCIGGPCDGVTCSGHGQCGVVAGGAICTCDPGYQDNDHDNSCLVTCQTSGLDCGELSCSDASGQATCVGVRSCATEVDYDPQGETITALYIRGEFNGWDLSAPFTHNADGTFSVTLDLPLGMYAYKLYDQGRDNWFEDPANPYFKWIDGVRNSRLRVADCDLPVLLLTGQPQVTGGHIYLQVRYIDGAQGAGLDPASVWITLNDAIINPAYDPASGLFTIDDDGLTPDKYSYRFKAADNQGRAADLLYVPLWVEGQSFSWADAILYFVLTDRFANGDEANDAQATGVDPKANWQGGDMAGISARIEAGYFDQLGVSALWISSVSQNTSGAGLGTDGRMYSAYHSYWPISTGWRADNQLAGVLPVDPHFGELADFKQLVRTAHQHGIRVLVDLVANHVHQDSPLWQAHAQDDPPWFHDKFICGWDQPINCWFADYLPDFDYRNLAVLDTVVEHAIWMIQETDIDGFRLDAVKHMIDDFSFALRARINESVSTSGLRFYIVGETFVGEDQAEADLIKHYVRPEMLDGQFDFPLYWQVIKTFLREEQDFRSLESMLQWNEGYYGGQAVMSNFLGNHDVCRALSHAAGDIADMWGNNSKEQGWTSPPALPSSPGPYQRLRLAWTFLMTIPGIPLVYYGDEFGMEGAGDPDNRKFMRFGAELNQYQQDTQAHFEKLTSARRTHSSFRRGSRTQLLLEPDGLVWAYALTDGADKAIVVFNRRTGSQSISIPLGATGIGDGASLREVIHETTATVSGGAVQVSLAGHDSAVLVME